MADEVLLLCYDGSDGAKAAAESAATLFASRRALVCVVWQPITAVSSLGWSVPIDGATIELLENEARSRAEQLAAEGVEVARAAGLEPEPYVVEAGSGPVWDAIVRAADERDVAAVAMGSRGLTRLRQMVLGSVSEGVVRHSARPVLIVH